MTRNTRLIGLVGGLGPAATVHYYQNLLAECQQRDLSPRLLINHADVGLVLPAAGRGDAVAVAEHLAERLRELQAAGAEVLAISAVTPHLAMPELAARFAAPVVDLVEVMRGELRRLDLRRVALLGTRASVASRMFGRLDDLVVDPSPAEIDAAHDLYVSIVQRRQVGEALADALRTMAIGYRDRLGVEAIVLAGTELALAPTATWEGLHVIDCAAVHIAAIVTAAAKVASG